NLPFQNDDLLAILKWCNGADNLSAYYAPIGHITRALKRYASENPIAGDLREAIKMFAVRLRGAYDKQEKRLATDVEQLCVDNQAESASDDVRQVDVLPVPRPAPAGCAGVLVELKQHLGMLTGDTKSSTTVIEPDRFALHDDSPLRHEHELL